VISDSLTRDDPLLNKLKHLDVFNQETIGKKHNKFLVRKLGALETSGARGLCPPSLYGCYATV